MKKLKLLLLILCVFSLFLVNGLSSLAVNAEQVVVKMQHGYPLDSPWHKAFTYMAEQMEARSGGQMIGEIYPNGVLYNLDWRLAVEQLQQNIVQVYCDSSIPFATVKKELFTICTPFMFDDMDHLYRWINSKPAVLDKWYKLLEDDDIIVLATWVRPPRQLSNSKKPIRKPEDMYGEKWRVPGLDLFVDIFNALGAKPVPISNAEIYTSIQLGTVIGEDNSIGQLWSYKIYEVVKYVNVWNYMFDVTMCVINKDFYEGLSDDQKTLLKTVANEAGKIDYEEEKKREAFAYKKVEEKGITFIHYTEEMKKPFKEKLLPINDKIRDIVGQEDWDSFVQSVNAVR